MGKGPVVVIDTKCSLLYCEGGPTWIDLGGRGQNWTWRGVAWHGTDGTAGVFGVYTLEVLAALFILLVVRWPSLWYIRLLLRSKKVYWIAV
jgi:hypothetical protein